MDFQLTEEQKMLQETVRRLADKEFKSREAELDLKAYFPEEYPAILAKAGLLGVTLPAEYGGGGMGAMEAVLIIEQLARVSPTAAAAAFESAAGPIRIISMHGTEEQKKKYIPRVCSGELSVGAGMSEPDAGSDLSSLTTKAVLDGDHYVVSGQKVFTGGAPIAQAYVVWVRMSAQKGGRGIGGIIIEKDTPGFTFGKPEHKMGIRSLPHASMYFDNCRVPKENLLIPEGGFATLMTAFGVERCGNAAMSLGIAQGAYELALEHVKVRKAFGREICEFQGLQWMLAEMAVKLDASRLLIYRAATNASAGFPSVLESAMAKMYANEITKQVCDDAMQLFGGYGYSSEYPLERMYRDARAWSIAGGTVQILRNTIAQLVLGRKFSQRKS